MKKSNSKERIQELMKYFGINQTELCRRTGIQKSALSNYLNGDREPRQDQISLIVDPFDVCPAWLMGYDVPMFMGACDDVADGDFKLTRIEREIIMRYRKADAFDQETVLRTLRVKRDDFVSSQEEVG